MEADVKHEELPIHEQILVSLPPLSSEPIGCRKNDAAGPRRAVITKITSGFLISGRSKIFPLARVPSFVGLRRPDRTQPPDFPIATAMNTPFHFRAGTTAVSLWLSLLGSGAIHAATFTGNCTLHGADANGGTTTLVESINAASYLVSDDTVFHQSQLRRSAMYPAVSQTRIPKPIFA